MVSKKRSNKSGVSALDNTLKVFGAGSSNLQLLSRLSGVEISHRGEEITFGKASAVKLVVVEKILGAMGQLAAQGVSVSQWDVECLYNLVSQHPKVDIDDYLKPALGGTSAGRRVSAKTPSQLKYLELIAQNDLVFGLGPAGTGKTYLAVAAAVEALNKDNVEKIIITRPAVEAGEKLGFLPGDLAEKVNPYLRPIYDALEDLLTGDRYAKLAERRVVEVAPLAFMRGRTLSKAFVILDEAQNTTREQMKMFLTRLGPGSKAVVTGDLSQSDLPGAFAEGLTQAVKILDGIEGIALCHFKSSDVVRHRLVKNIIKAYERAEAAK